MSSAEVVNAEERTEDALRRLARRLVAIDDLHQQRVRTVDGHTLRWCRECQQDWPCPTYSVSHGDHDDELARA